MVTTVAVVLGVAGLAIAMFVLGFVIPAYIRNRGRRVVTCPDNHQPVDIAANALLAALYESIRRRKLRLSQCSRWPEKRNCGQECLREIENSPDGCLVREILTRWYDGKACVFCQKPFGEITWMAHKPCLMNTDFEVFEWHEIPAEKLGEALATHLPVCWGCHIAETFRKEFSELVVDRRTAGGGHSRAASA